MTKLAMFAAAALLAAAPVGAGPEDEDQGGGYLGVRLQKIDGGLAEALDLKPDSGVLLGQVLDDSPAAKAGLLSGDIVTKIADKAVGTPREFRDAIRDAHAGDVVSIEYRRDGKARTARATLGEADSSELSEQRDFPKLDGMRKHMRSVRDLRAGREHGWLGVYTQPLSGDLGGFFGTKDGGALVAEVVEDSPAAKLGLKPGDVIVKIDEQKIEDPDDLRNAVGEHEEPVDVDVSWVRDHREQHGKTKLEVREGFAMFDGPVSPESLWSPEEGQAMRQRVHAFGRRAQDETERALQDLKKQVEKLQEQMKKLESKTH